jgi:hypothetical protein
MVNATRRRSYLGTQEFIPGDVWRGTMTNCQQTELHVKKRRLRYVPIELSIDHVNKNEITATFVTHYDRSFYEMTGRYEPAGRRLYLEPKRGKLGKHWIACDAEAFVSPDFSSMSGLTYNCFQDQDKECDPGGGEFMLRHDRTRFVVEGAGDARVNGEYAAQPRLGKAKADVLYEGAPVYLQEGGPFALVHEVIGQYGFWRITQAVNLEYRVPDSSDGALYSAWSEDVYPPENGWRPLLNKRRGAPAPTVRPAVRSMYVGLAIPRNLRAGADDDSGFYGDASLLVAMILVLGLVLWCFVLRCGRRVRLKGGNRTRRRSLSGSSPSPSMSARKAYAIP